MKKLKTCTNPACGRKHRYSTRLCCACHKRLRVYGDVDANFTRKPNTECQVPGCPNPPTGTYCSTHRQRKYRYGDPLLTAKTARPRAFVKCSEDHCGRKAKIRGLCDRCDKRRRRGTLGQPITNGMRELCSVPWCPRVSIAKGCCPRHYEHLQQYGDPYLTKRYGRETQPDHCEECEGKIVARGLCLVHLKRAAKYIPQLRPFLPSFPGAGTCFERTGCRQNAQLWGKCPACLHTWKKDAA